MPNRVIANVYLRSGANRRIYTTPGRTLQFFGGHATVVNHVDMPHALQLEGALVQPSPDAMPWAQDWLKRVKEIKAEVAWPEGWAVEFKNQDEFKITGDGGSAEHHATPTVSEPVVTVDMTARPVGWINPNLLLEGPDEEDFPKSEVHRGRRRAKST